MTLCDAGPLYALVDRKQPKHSILRKTLPTLSMPLVTTWPCLTEAMYLALHRGGWPMQRLLLQLLLEGMLTIYEIQPNDYPRLEQLLTQYQDRPMDLADSTLVLAAERLGLQHILTSDSDFFFYLINNSVPFHVIPLA